MKKEEFINLVAPLVQNANLIRNTPLFNSVVIAQAICETGWGKSNIMMKAKAIFGIKANKNWKSKVYNSKTKECYDGIKYTTISACFRAYDSYQESVNDYFKLICENSRYKKALNCKNYKECITAIKNGGYATSPTYINTICSIIENNNLTRFDKKESVDNVENSVDKPNYKINGDYKLQVDLKVRSGSSTNFRQKDFKELTADGKKHAYLQEKAVLKKGTIITCKDIIKKSNGDIWLRIPSGFVAGFYEGKVYIK